MNDDGTPGSRSGWPWWLRVMELSSGTRNNVAEFRTSVFHRRGQGAWTSSSQPSWSCGRVCRCRPGAGCEATRSLHYAGWEAPVPGVLNPGRGPDISVRGVLLIG